MVLDASALTAMLTDESDARELIARLAKYPRRVTSPLSVWESTIAVARILGLSVGEAREAVERFLALLEVDIRPVPPRSGRPRARGL